MLLLLLFLFFFFFNDTATTEIYTLSLHDALPISISDSLRRELLPFGVKVIVIEPGTFKTAIWSKVEAMDRSEEHTSELQSLAYLVCRLLLEKKKKHKKKNRVMKNQRDR